MHTGKLRIRPFDVAEPAGFDHDAELLGFFDEHLRGLPAPPEITGQVLIIGYNRGKYDGKPRLAHNYRITRNALY